MAQLVIPAKCGFQFVARLRRFLGVLLGEAVRSDVLGAVGINGENHEVSRAELLADLLGLRDGDGHVKYQRGPQTGLF
jgi:hypothetical protein